MMYTLEICCYSLESCLAAEEGGAHRIELCGGMYEGGTTPSAGTISLVKEAVNLPVQVMIRPRGGDFLYSDWEMKQMIRDVQMARELGADGVVFGMLKADGSLDVERMSQLAEEARGMEITLHRAFDMCRDPEQAIEHAKSLGFNRILTSGLKNTAWEGRENLKKLALSAGSTMPLMAGSGINHENIEKLASVEGLSQFHMSGMVSRPSGMGYQNPDISMGKKGEVSEYEVFYSDIVKIKKASSVLLDLEKKSEIKEKDC
ncbi:MAG: copper homeostasis protein CutC [Cytophagales bacterium]|nr:copper homeostasis protein CutC [Cytophagales bacterium]